MNEDAKNTFIQHTNDSQGDPRMVRRNHQCEQNILPTKDGRGAECCYPL